MNKLHLILMTIAALTIGTGVSVCAAGEGGGGRAGGAAAAPANLDAAMKDMQRMYTALKAEAPDKAKKAQALKDVTQLERDVSISKMLAPPTLATMPADKKTEEANNYRLMMNQLSQRLFELEDAIDAEKPDDVKKALSAIEDVMKQGHMEFQPKEE